MDNLNVASRSFPVVPVLQHTDELDLPAPNGSSKSQKTSPSATIACFQCRSRKVRCDGGQPKCKNCTRRSEDCEYIVRKPRGPDKQPGGRVRKWRNKPTGYINPQSVERAKRSKDEQLNELRRAMPESVRNAATTRTVSEDYDSVSPPSTSSLPNHTYPVPLEDQNPSWSFKNTAPYNLDIDQQTEPLGFLPHTTQTNHMHYGPSYMFNDIPRGPSVSFNKDIWWNNLLQIYCEDPSQSAQMILQDVTFLFNNAVYWYSFVNLPLLLERLRDPIQRTNLQPSVVFSALAISTLMKSSETGLGDKGRRHALMLRDAAQASLEASVSAGWIEPSLAQAALLLTLFEMSAHPSQSSSRLTSAVFLMDSLIRALGLLILDAHEPTVSIFPVDEIPVTSNILNMTLQPGETLFSGSSQYESHKQCPCPDTTSELVELPLSFILGKTQGWDEEFVESLLRPMPSLQSLDVLKVKSTLRKIWLGLPPDESDRVWDHTTQSGGGGNISHGIVPKHPQWLDLESRAEIQREELRRLCWTALIVTTNLTEFTPYLGQSSWNLHITRQENFAIFFPGQAKSFSSSESYSRKETIWALHCRTVLLWNISQRLRLRPDWEFRKAEFSGRAWMEASAIESALARHTCAIARGALYPVRESLFQLKLLISNNFTRCIPLPHTLRFERNSAEEWLTHRGEIACHVRKVVYFITRFGAGPAALSLARRPLGVWWTLHQIQAGTLAWKSDQSLKYALEHSLDFVALADFMTTMWPSPDQRAYYLKLKKELAEACMIAGVVIPAPIPIPGLPHYPEATMTPSPRLPRLPASADIPILPLD